MASQLPWGPLPLAQSPYLTLLQKICVKDLSTGPHPGSDRPAVQGLGLKLSDPVSDSDKARLSSSTFLCSERPDNIIWGGSSIFDPTVGCSDKAIFSFPEIPDVARTR